MSHGGYLCVEAQIQRNWRCWYDSVNYILIIVFWLSSLHNFSHKYKSDFRLPKDIKHSKRKDWYLEIAGAVLRYSSIKQNDDQMFIDLANVELPFEYQIVPGPKTIKRKSGLRSFSQQSGLGNRKWPGYLFAQGLSTQQHFFTLFQGLSEHSATKVILLIKVGKRKPNENQNQ